MDLNFAIIQKMSVIHKTIYKGPLKCWNVVITLPCGTNFNGVELCLNNPKPKKCTLLCHHLYLSLQGGRKPVPSCSHIQLPNWVFKSLGWMYLGQKQSSKLNQGFIHRVASIRIFLMWSGIFPVAMQCKLAREKRSLKKKKKRNGTSPSFHRVKNWSPWEKQMFGTANPSALSHSNSVRWAHPSLPEYAMLLSMETGFQPQRIRYNVLGIHMSSHERVSFFVCLFVPDAQVSNASLSSFFLPCPSSRFISHWNL